MLTESTSSTEGNRQNLDVLIQISYMIVVVKIYYPLIQIHVFLWEVNLDQKLDYHHWGDDTRNILIHCPRTHDTDVVTLNVHKSDILLPIRYHNRRSMIKSRWPLYRVFGMHVKTDNANRLADPEKLYNTRFQGNSEKNSVARWRPFWLSVGSWKSSQVISILMGNFT